MAIIWAIIYNHIYSMYDNMTNFMVKGQIDPPWRLIKLVQDIRRLVTSFDFINFIYVFREANFVANAIANLSHFTGFNLCWNNMIPNEASRVLLFDIVNFGWLRDFVL